MLAATSRRSDAIYWFISWLALSLHLSRFFDLAGFSWLLLYQIVLISSYGFLFLIPAWLLFNASKQFSEKASFITSIVAVSATQLALYGDYLLWQLYGFHLNGFVWNIITTPGGVAALGASASTERDFAFIAIGWTVLQFVFRVVAWFCSHIRNFPKPPRLAWIIPVFFIATLGERLSYGLSHFYGYSPLLESAQRVPFYQPLTLRGTLEKMGFERPQRLEVAGAELKGTLRYPQKPLSVETPQKPLNIVWLVSESWRADTLNERVMPQMTQFAARSQQFNNHFSGGNGTRIGMFSQFYGLPASLWFQVLDARIGSPLIDVLQKQDYQMKLFTSARFSYPEFDKTIFVNVPADKLVSDDEGETWKRDRRNVERLMDFIDKRDPNKPFMTFMFFESPHANYNFPPESIIEPDYLPDFSYASMDLNRDIRKIHNRYLNAVHHLDSQMSRVTRYLEEKGLLENTIVIITGDHGEEFMEKGRWGHNSTFVDEQIRVPMIMWIPGQGAHQEQLRTSHADVLPTLLPLLGVKNTAADYSIGRSLLEPKSDRLLLAGDWDRLTFLGEKYKVVLPFSSNSFVSTQIFQANDETVESKSEALQQSLPRVQAEMADLRRFMAH